MFTGIPVIITHPSDEVTNATVSVTLNCEAAGGGSIMYEWETSDIAKDQWTIIGDSDGRTLVIRNLEKSEKYRCVASNDAGSVISNSSTVAFLGKLLIKAGILFNYIFYRDHHSSNKSRNCYSIGECHFNMFSIC